MKYIKGFCSVVLAAACIFTSCSSTPKVERVSSDVELDLSGNWNATDVKLAANEIISEFLESPRIKNYSTTNDGKLPVVILGSYRNQSDEHMDTGILTKKVEEALINSGLVDFVADSSAREEIMAELEWQQGNASEDTAKNLANATGADFMIQGSVKTITDANDKTTYRTYYISTELIEIETQKKVWVNENDSIRKVIGKSKIRK